MQFPAVVRLQIVTTGRVKVCEAKILTNVPQKREERREGAEEREKEGVSVDVASCEAYFAAKRKTVDCCISSSQPKM